MARRLGMVTQGNLAETSPRVLRSEHARRLQTQSVPATKAQARCDRVGPPTSDRPLAHSAVPGSRSVVMRRRHQGQNRQNMMTQQSPLKLLETALAGVAEVQALDAKTRETFLKQCGPIPPNVPLADGSSVLTTTEGLDAVYQFGRVWRSLSTSARQDITKTTASTWALKTFGELIGAEGSVLQIDPKAAAAHLQQQLDARLASLSRDIVHSFPCRIFDDVSMGAFSVGPAKFLPLEAWLDDLEARANGKASWVESVRGLLRDPASNAAEHQARVSSLPAKAKEVLDAVAGCNWVATVAIRGAAPDRSKERAATTVRLALNALGVQMALRDAGNLRGPGDELRATQTFSLTQLDDRDIGIAVSLDLPRLGGKPGQASSQVAGSQAYRAAVGKALTVITSPPPRSKEPPLLQRWCDALYWFGEARRDATEFMAIVRYGMTLDVLAKGLKARGITNLLCALFAMTPGDKVLVDGTTLEMLLKRIYDECRSQLGHGGRAALLQDLPVSREQVDYLTSAALEEYLMYLDAYQGSDTYEDFLKAIPTLRPPRPPSV